MLLAGPLAAAECDGVRLPDSAKVSNAALTLNGLGIRKATLLKVHVYVAGLYLPAPSRDPAAVLAATSPWHLELHFVRAAGAKDIRGAWQEGFAANAPSQVAALQPRIDQMNRLMPDMHKGGVLAFSYAPGSGVTVGVDGKPAGTIEGDDFAKALLSIWLGQEPPNAELKAGLLGAACG
jgi:hypothetical protein